MLKRFAFAILLGLSSVVSIGAAETSSETEEPDVYGVGKPDDRQWEIRKGKIKELSAKQRINIDH